MSSVAEKHVATKRAGPVRDDIETHSQTDLGLLTGCQDRPYALELALSVAAKGVWVDVIGSDEIDSPELHNTPNVRFLNLRGRATEKVGVGTRLWKLADYYAKLMRYAAHEKPKALHILWNNKVEFFDRTILMAYYKMMGKKIAFTAHNVNQARRDARDSFLNRFTLRIQYALCDRIFVHTRKMGDELREGFHVPEEKIVVIRHPVNNVFPDTDLTPAKAKQRLGLRPDEKAVLCLGRLRPYKGVEHLLAAFRPLVEKDQSYRLIIAGEPKKGSEDYRAEIERSVEKDFESGTVILKIQFIPDEDMELYLKAADVLVLPYKEIFQSGVLFLAYSFGLPVVATDVGSFREEIVEGRTGFLANPASTADLAAAIETYFASDLYENLDARRQDIKDYANANHSWSAVADLTRNAYAAMLGANQ